MRGHKIRLAAGVGIWCALFVALAAPGFASTLSVGDVAPDFALYEFGTEQEVNLYDFEDKIVLLEFFAYWGSPCRAASSELELKVQQYYEALGGNASGVDVQLVSINIQANAAASTQNYINAYGLDVVLDDPQQEVYQAYGGVGVPQFALINGAADTNFQQWEILDMPLGFLSNSPDHDYRAFREVIESVQRVPEPSTFVLLALGGTLLIGGSRLRHAG